MKRKFLTTRELAVFALLGSFMFISKLLMEGLPNVHLLGMLTISYTLVYRKKALIPIYVYVLLNGLYAGFNMWWVPYLYIWTVLWAITMLLPKKMPKKVSAVVYPLLCALHGLAFGTLYAPAQALMFGLSFENTIRWIVAGLPWDAVHAVGNLATGLLILPTVAVLKRLEKQG
ncbi:MAG: hypothetical protein J6A55_05965 [Oscillospiraceae bacterium]|nr:hypothetical protein [Oscillospiraceae bacterium]